MSDCKLPRRIWPARGALAGALAALGLAAPSLAPAQALMTWADLTRAPAPHASQRVQYGEGSSQVAELWLPDGPGPHPVVLMIHGGCWQARIAGLHIMDYIADDLRRRGIAVWNIEYRGVDQPGGGYPGSFQDVASAADALRAAAAANHLDLRRVVASGRSIA